MTPEKAPTDEDLLEALKKVIDPELGINVVDLGLVYGLENDESRVRVMMTLTSAACPLTDVLEDQVTDVLVNSGLVLEAEIVWVWTPAWSLEQITPDGKEQLLALGFNV